MVYSYNGYYIRLSAERQGFNSLIDRQLYAGMAELVDALHLGCSVIGVGFQVPLPVPQGSWTSVLKRSPRKEPNNAVGNLGIESYLRVAQFA